MTNSSTISFAITVGNSGGAVEGEYDVLVTSQAELNDILDGTTPVSAGNVIALAPGTYDPQSTVLGVTWTSQFFDNRAKVRGWNLKQSIGTGGFTLDRVDVEAIYPTNEVGFWAGAGSSPTYAIINADNSSATFITIKNCNADGGLAHFLEGGFHSHNAPFLYVRGGGNVTVENCDISRCAYGMIFDGVDGITLKNNTVHRFHADPIRFGNAAGPCKNVLMKDNTLVLPAGNASGLHSDGVQGVPKSKSGNFFEDWEIVGNVLSNGVPGGNVPPHCAQIDESLRGVVFSAGSSTIAVGDTVDLVDPSNATPIRGQFYVVRAFLDAGTWAGGDAQGVIFGHIIDGAWTGTTELHASGLKIANIVDRSNARIYPKVLSGADIDKGLHASDIRVNSATNETIQMPSAVGNAGEQYLFRVGDIGANTVSFSLNGSDTYDGGTTTPDLGPSRNFATFVSDGAGNWEKITPGFRSWWLRRKASFTAGDLEDGLVVLLDAGSNNVTMTIPASGRRTYHILRMDNSANTCNVVTSGGDLISLSGLSRETVPLTPGYGFNITRSDDGNWTGTEGKSTFTAIFSNHNSGNWRNIHIHGNIACMSGGLFRIEDDVTNLTVNNNAGLPYIVADQNADEVIGRYEGNGESPLSQLSGTGVSQANVSAGNLAAAGSRDPLLSVNDDYLSLSTQDPLPTSVTSRWAASDFVKNTRAEIIQAALALPDGPLDTNFRGPVGTSASNGYYNFDTGAVNTAALPAPLLTQSLPAHQATEIGADATTTLTFNQKVGAGTGNIVLRAGGVAVETFNVATGLGDNGGTVAFSGARATITPGAAMAMGVEHAIRVDATAVVGSIYQKSYAGIADDTTLTFTTAASSLSFASSITQTTNNSDDMRYVRSLTTRNNFEWMTGSEVQSFDTTNAVAMSQATKDALLLNNTSFVFVFDFRKSTEWASGSMTVRVRNFDGTDPFSEAASYDLDTENWVSSPSGIFASAGVSDVSDLYGLTSGSGEVFRLFVPWTQSADHSRLTVLANDSNDAFDFRRMAIFTRSTFDVDDATMATEIAGLTP